MQGGYKAVIVDSIQTLAMQQIQTPAGSVGQITNSTHLLSEVAKKTKEFTQPTHVKNVYDKSSSQIAIH